MSLAYLLFRRVLAVAALRLRSRDFKELEIVVLRHELAVLRRQIARPRLEDADRVFLAAASRLLRGTGQQSFFVRPDTVLGWHRRLVRRRWTYAGRRPGRPAVSEDIHELVLQVARENPRWGYQRIVGELAGVGVQIGATTVRTILRQAGDAFRRGAGWALLARRRAFGASGIHHCADVVHPLERRGPARLPARRERVAAVRIAFGDPTLAVLDLVLGVQPLGHLAALRLGLGFRRSDVRGALVALYLVLPAAAGVGAGDDRGLLRHGDLPSSPV